MNELSNCTINILNSRSAKKLYSSLKQVIFGYVHQRWTQVSKEMEFANKEVRQHFERALETLGTADPYDTPSTLGIFDVIRAHYLIADFFLTEQRELGGIGCHNLEALHSALDRPFAGYGGQGKWTEFFDKAATTLFGLIKNHPFHDANKRTALLSILYLFAKKGLTARCTKKEFEDLTVEIADMEIVKRARYRQLTKENDDPEVRYISHWLRRNSRPIDRREYTITYRELRQILGRFGFIMENQSDNRIDIIKVTKRTGILSLVSGEQRTRIGRIGCLAETKQVSKEDLRRVRKLCDLTAKKGVDSQSFYHNVDDMTSLLAEYQDNIRRLANR